MNTRIDRVDYQDVSSKAKIIREHARKQNQEFCLIYEQIINLHQDWFGDQYKSLAIDFNNLAPYINNMTHLTLYEIPVALENIANNYSRCDTGSNVTSVDTTREKKVQDIPIPNDGTVLRYEADKVETARDSVSKGFENVGIEMQAIENVYNRIDWQSDASDAFRKKFGELRDHILGEITRINSEFNRLMKEAAENIGHSEKANTVD